MFKTEQAAPKNIPNIPSPKSIAMVVSMILLGKTKISVIKTTINAKIFIILPFWASISKKGRECKKQASE